MPTLPLVSCVMPTYGRPAYVNESVEMFLLQDYPNKELIIFNDCVGQNFTGEYPNVRIVNWAPRFITLGEKRNSCISMADGSLIAIWDDDDVYPPWRLSYCVSEMERLGIQFYRPAESWAYWGRETLNDNLVAPGWGNHGSVMFSKNLWKEVAGYPAADCGEDVVFFERVHNQLGETLIAYDIALKDRFYILRGKSHYVHMSMRGGRHPLDIRPGDHPITPTAIRDPILCAAHDRLVASRG
jgi:glycosyltransferase involved in cell wall biosynthesis